MIKIFIDESGSITTTHADTIPQFVICLIKVNDEKNLRKVIKKFITKYLQELKRCDLNKKMFVNNKFVELKGSSLSKDLKEALVNYICQYNLFEIYYINLDNKLVNPDITKNTACLYNFLIELCLEENLINNNLKKDEILLNIDERNLQIIAHNSLEDYLNIKLQIENQLSEDINVVYFDSRKDILIQLADFFSNLYFSYLRQPDAYEHVFEKLFKEEYIKRITYFPKNL